MQSNSNLFSHLRSRFTGLPLIVQIFFLVILAVSLPVAVLVLKSGGLKFLPKAAVTDPEIYFAPSSYSLPPDQTVSVYLNAKAHMVSFALIEINFDHTKIKLTGEVTTTPQLPGIVSKTTMATANSTGKIILALTPCDPLQGQCDPKPTPPAGLIQFASFPISAINSTTNSSSAISINNSNVQLVDPNTNVLPFTSTSATVGIGGPTVTPTGSNPPITIQPSPSSTPVPTPTSVPPAGTGAVSLTPVSGTLSLGQVFPVTIKFNTLSNVISSFTLRLTFPYSSGQTAPSINVVNANGTPVSQISVLPPFSTSSSWSFPVNSVTRANGLVTIDLAATNVSTSGFTSTTDQSVATFYLMASAIPPTNPTTLSFDLSQSKMMTKSAPTTNILSTPVNGTYTVIGAPEFTYTHRMQGVDIPSVSRTDDLSIISSGVTYPYSASVVSDNSGLFMTASPLALAGLPVGTPGTGYLVYIKSPGYLRKAFGNITFSAGLNVAPSSWSQIELLAGDFNGDNILNISDLGLQLASYTALTVPVTTNIRIYDIDGDNNITIYDVAIVLSNYTSLEVYGD